MDQQYLPIPLLSKISSPTPPSVVSALPSIPLQWAEPTVTRAYSRRGNHMVYLTGVTPYIPGVDGAKNSLVGACELFHNRYKVTNTNSKIIHGKSDYSLIGILKSLLTHKIQVW